MAKQKRMSHAEWKAGQMATPVTRLVERLKELQYKLGLLEGRPLKGVIITTRGEHHICVCAPFKAYWERFATGDFWSRVKDLPTNCGPKAFIEALGKGEDGHEPDA